MIWTRKKAAAEEQLGMNYLLDVNSEKQHKRRTRGENTQKMRVLSFDHVKILQQETALPILYYNQNHDVFCSTENVSKEWNSIQNAKLYFY